MSEEKFCLKWNDFESNISSSFRELCEAKDLFDLTLVCGEFQQFQAHKVVLSASSPFFRRVLCQSHQKNTNNPMIYLRGISQTDLQYILDFIYYGEVNVTQDNLNSFLTVAEDLQIKGLTQGQNDSKPKPSSNSQPRKPVSKTAKSLTAYDQNTKSTPPPPDDDIVEVPVRVKNEEAENHSVAIEQDYSSGGYGGDIMDYDGEAGGYDEMGTGLQDYDVDKGQYYISNNFPTCSSTFLCIECSGEIFSLFLGSSTEYLDELISTKMFKILGGWQCVDCHKEYKQKGDLSRHVESSHIDHPGCSCSFCGKIFKTRDSLRNHHYQSHRQ